jgi:hypothetical protein
MKFSMEFHERFTERFSPGNCDFGSERVNLTCGMALSVFKVQVRCLIVVLLCFEAFITLLINVNKSTYPYVNESYFCVTARVVNIIKLNQNSKYLSL